MILDRSVNWKRQISCLCSGVSTIMCQNICSVTSPDCGRFLSTSAPTLSSLLSEGVCLFVCLSIDRRLNTPPFDPTVHQRSHETHHKEATSTLHIRKDQSHHYHRRPCCLEVIIDHPWCSSSDTMCVRKQEALSPTSPRQHPRDVDKQTSGSHPCHPRLPKSHRPGIVHGRQQPLWFPL